MHFLLDKLVRANICAQYNSTLRFLSRFRILQIVITCQLLSVCALQAQHLAEEFRPKIKSSPHTANHIVQADGKIVMLGDYAFVGDTPMPHLLRFETDGSLDKNFNLSSDLRDQFTTDFSICCTRSTVVLGPDGDLVLTQPGSRRRVTIIDQAGKFKTDIAIPQGYFQIERLIKHKDGYIAIVHKTGSAESVFRLNKNGTIDPAFARIDYTGYVENMIVDTGNNVFIVGDLTIAGTSRNLIKINELGVLDNSFNNVPLPGSFHEIDLFADGKIVVSTYTTIVLLDAQGNKIASFIPETNGKQIFSSVIDHDNNRIIILLEQYPLPKAIKALELDGSLSDLFTPIEIGDRDANALSQISRVNGKFVLTTGNDIGYVDASYSFMVFDADGNVDAEISGKEKLFKVGHVAAAVELEDGNLIIGGEFSHIGNTQVNNLAKIDKTGQADLSFASNNPLLKSDKVREVKMSPSGQLYVGGYFKDILGADLSSLIRLNKEGSLDASFVTDQSSWASHTFLDDFIIMPDRIIACGYYNNGSVVAFDFSGNTVPTFNTNIFGGERVQVGSLCKIDDDNFAIGGEVLNGKGFLWIMDKNGNIDPSFVRQDQISISSDHMVKVGNDLYRSGSILGGQSSLDLNFVHKYDLVTGAIAATKLGTTVFSKNLHFLSLNDSTAVVSGKFDHFNNAVANNIAVSDYKGRIYSRFNFQVSKGIEDKYIEKTVALSNERVLLLGQFNKINDDPYYSVAILNYTNFKPRVKIDDSYSIPEDTSFYLTDLIEIIDEDDQVRIDAKQNDNLTIDANGLVTLKPNFNGSIEFQFSVADPILTVGPFTTTFEVRPVNDVPIITAQREFPSILPGDSYEVKIGMLDVVDADGDELTVVLHAGDNYTLQDGTTFQSDVNFSGTLKVEVVVSDGSASSNAFIVRVESALPTGIEEASELAYYPNPFTDYIRIDSWENIQHLSIRSITGQELVGFSHDELKEREGVIQAKMLPVGMFVLSAVLNTNEVRHVKLVKQ